MASVKNTVIVAMMQVGVIVAGVLAAGICHKIWSTNGATMPLPAAMVYSYGFASFLIPVVWGAGAIILQLRSNVSEDIKALSFWLGVFVLIGLAAFLIYADVTPWFHMTWNVSGDSDS